MATHRELIAASAAVLLLVIVLPALFLAILYHWRKQRLGQMFAALPRSIRDILLRQPSLLRHRQLRNLSYLHCEFDAGHREENATAQLKRCASLRNALAQAVLAEGGTLDFQSAHSLGAYWNAPLKDAQHALHASAAALHMKEVALAHNHFPLTQSAGTSTQVQLAVGIATGEAAIGIVDRHYLVEGAAPRRAGEFAQACFRLGYDVLADSETRARASLAFLPLRERFGDANAAQPFALLGDRMMRSSPMFYAIETFHVRIFAAADKNDWPAAAALTAQARKLSGGSAHYYDRLQAQIEAMRDSLAPSASVQRAA